MSVTVTLDRLAARAALRAITAQQAALGHASHTLGAGTSARHIDEQTRLREAEAAIDKALQ